MRNNTKKITDKNLLVVGWVLMGLTIIILICGSMGCRSESKVTFGGEAKMRTIIDINFEVCDSLPDQEKIDCVQTLLEILKAATEKDLNGEDGILAN